MFSGLGIPEADTRHRLSSSEINCAVLRHLKVKLEKSYGRKRVRVNISRNSGTGFDLAKRDFTV